MTSLSLDAWKDFCDGFAEAQLRPYIQQLSARATDFSRKEINDSIWGTVALLPVEVALLDSPLLQRLRSVRQLGVVHWVYPGASHTRFEHAIGVVHQVQRLADAINAAATRADHRPPISSQHIQILRLCALLHDIGHGAFSHVSEMALESAEEIALLLAEFARRQRIERKSLSEVTAYYVIRSPAMKELLGAVLVRGKHSMQLADQPAVNVQRSVDMIAAAIIGTKIDDRCPLLHELISGPFDADKLDYFVRDAKYAGIPSLVDISRLEQKLVVSMLPADKLPQLVGGSVDDIGGDKHAMFGLKWSGVGVLDELQLARVLLYAKIYRHPKVTAIEQMLSTSIRTMIESAGVLPTAHLLYTCPDDAILNLDKHSLSRLVRGANSKEGQATEADDRRHDQLLQLAAAILNSIRDRQLWALAFQIATLYPSAENNGVEKERLVRFIEDVEHPQKRHAFMDRLFADLEFIAATLFPEESLVRSDLEGQVALHAQKALPGGTQIERAYLLDEGEGEVPVPFRQYKVNRTGWADSYHADQPRGFIFCRPLLADAVFLGVERILRRDYDVSLPRSAAGVSKRDPEKLKLGRQRLEAAGFYRGLPLDMRPLPARLEKADVKGRIAAFESRVRGNFLEPVSPDGTLDTRGRSRTMTWLQQFQNDDHIECALHILDGFKVLNRADTTAALQGFVGAHPEFKNALVVPLGSGKDSGAVQTYLAGDIVGTELARLASLDEIGDVGPDVPIIFIDDFLGSGNQASDLLGAGFEILALRKDLGEKRLPFPAKVRDVLQTNKIAFVFSAAWNDGVSTLRRAATTAGIKGAEVFALYSDKDIPLAQQYLAQQGVAKGQIESFLERCRLIGADLLKTSTSAEKFPERLLGYGNRAMLLATPVNVPSQSLTLVWADGEALGERWMPLLARRKKV